MIRRVVVLHALSPDGRYSCGRPVPPYQEQLDREADIAECGWKWRYCLQCRRARERDPRKHGGTLPR